MSGSRPRPYLGPVIALLVVLALGAGTVYAAIPNGNGKYYACLVKSTGAVRLINYPKVKTCPKGEQLINWNAKGPAGAQGPVGATGAQGPAGPSDWNAIPNKPAGFADGIDNEGVTKVTITTKTGSYVSVPPGEWEYAVVECPAGSKAIGGGPVSNSEFLYATDSYPINFSTGKWTVWARNAEPEPGATVHTFAASVVCMSVEPSGAMTAANKGVRPAKLRKHK